MVMTQAKKLDHYRAAEAPPPLSDIIFRALATLSPVPDFPVCRFYGSLLRRFRDGARRASPVAWRILVIVLSLWPRQSGLASFSQSATIQAALAPMKKARPPGFRFEPTSAFIRYGPMTRSPSFDGFVDRLSGFSFLPPDYPSYRVPDYCPGGTVSY